MYLIILSILLSLLYYYMGFYAFFVQKNALSNRLFLLLTILFSSWSLSGGFFNTMNIPAFSLIWMFTSYLIWTIGTALILQFCLSLNRAKSHLKLSTLGMVYAPALIMLLGMVFFNGLSPSNRIYDTPIKLIFGIPGGIGFYIIYISISIVHLIGLGKNSDNYRVKQQSKLVSRSLLVTSILIGIYGFILPHFVSKPLPVLLPFFPIIWIISMYVSITKYGFLTVTMEVATKNILDNIQEIIILTDNKCMIIDVNKRFEEAVALNKTDINGKKLSDILSKNPTIMQHVEQVLNCEMPFYSGDTDLNLGDDKYMPTRLHITAIKDHLSHVIGVVIAASDLTLEKRYELLAITDSLTTAYNRMKMERIIERLLQDRENFSVILFDMDLFKKVNDEFGHATGDRVLISTVNLINQELRAIDYLGRWGGEEFLIVLPNTLKQVAFQVSERIRTLVSEHDFGLNRSITISLGVADSSDETISLAKIVNNADQALYAAKSAGRNMTMIYSEHVE